MPRHRKSQHDNHAKNIGKATPSNRLELERDRIRDAIRNIQRSLTDRNKPVLSPKTILSLQQVVGNRALQRLIPDQDHSVEEPASIKVSGSETVQRYDYEFEDDPLHGTGSDYGDQTSKEGSEDSSGEGYGYEFEDDSKQGGGSTNWEGTSNAGMGESSGEGYGYEFEDDSKQGGGSTDWEGTSNAGMGDQGGEGYGYEFEDDSEQGGGSTDWEEASDEGSDDDSGEGYGYEFGEDPLAF
jgi:hypothetical protein